MSDLPEYLLDREFDAPRDVVWRAWTDPELLSRWYGPGVETIIHQFDLQAGGTWLNEMRWGDNADFSKMVFQEVVEGEKMVWLQSSSDSEWNIITSPMMPGWPRVLQTTVTFEELGAKTKVRLTMVPIDATDEEIVCFAEAMSGMDNGWGGGYKILDEMFEEMRNE
jgi:uncharacterized protein YndB with AHSA1/START domain